MIRLPLVVHLVFTEDLESYTTRRRVRDVGPLVQAANSILETAGVSLEVLMAKRFDWKAEQWDRVLPNPRPAAGRTSPADPMLLRETSAFVDDAVNLYLIGPLQGTVCKAYRELPALLLPDPSQHFALGWAVGNLLGLRGVQEAGRMMALRDRGSVLTDEEKHLLQGGALELLQRLRGATEFERVRARTFPFPIDLGPEGRLTCRLPPSMEALQAGDYFIFPQGANAGRGILIRVNRVYAATPEAAPLGAPGCYRDPTVLKDSRYLAEYEGAGLVWLPFTMEGPLVEVDRIPRPARFDEAPSEAMRQAVEELIEHPPPNVPPRVIAELRHLQSAPTIGPWLMLLCTEFRGFLPCVFNKSSLVERAEQRLQALTIAAQEEAGRDVQARVERRKHEESERMARCLVPQGPWQERSMTVGTEVASWALFHPDDVSFHDDWAAPWPEGMAKGLALGIDTRCDGGYRIRFTMGPLTQVEREHLVQQVELRLDVRHGCLYLGEPHDMPNDDSLRDICIALNGRFYDQQLALPDRWLSVPTGLYRARVTSLNQTDDDYVVQFEPVASLDDIPFPPLNVRMDPLPIMPPWQSIRRLEPDDWDLLRTVRLAALQDAPMAFGSTHAREVLFDEATWRRRISDGIWLVDMADRAVVGLLGAFPQEDGWHVVSMWVSPPYRRRRCALRLVEELVRHAKAAGARYLDLYVVDDNEPARRLYERYGFKPSGVQRPYPNAPGLTESHMRLEI